ncbi:MAG TPA: PHB depolymerase family esterase [Myxococcota bacterium]|nr:PHB depolymerase family esterase [Myxococcota bacterium]
MVRSLPLLLLMTLSCGGAVDPPRSGTLHEDQTYEHGGTTRTYHFYETAGDGARPLVLLLHGGGGVIDNHIGLGGVSWPHQVWLDIADEEGLHVLVPQGISRHWNDCRAECTRCGDEDDVGFLVGLLDDVATQYPVDLERVYVVGESNGGFMTQRLAQEVPERFAAMGVVIALQPAESDCTALDVPMPLMYQVGTADAAILYEGGASDSNTSVLSAAETVAYWRDLNGCEATPTTTSLDDLDPDDSSTVSRDDYSCDQGALSVLTMDGAGHVPPSIEVEVSAFWEGIAGIQNHDIEGARVFWTFFSGRSR